MSALIRIVWFVALTWVLAAPLSPARAQMDQQALARTILGSDQRAAKLALDEATRALAPAEMGPELRAALIAVLERQNEVYLTYTKMMASGVVDGIEDPNEFPPAMQEFWREGYIFLVEAVIALRDPLAIPALAGAVGHGDRVARALAEFGEEAAPALLSVAEGGAREEDQAIFAMRALTLMVEDPKGQRLSRSTLDRMRRLVREQLTTETQYPSMIRSWSNLRAIRAEAAISLALTLGDPSLREVVHSLARDSESVRRLGVEDAANMERIQRHAAEALARPPRRR